MRNTSFDSHHDVSVLMSVRYLYRRATVEEDTLVFH